MKRILASILAKICTLAVFVTETSASLGPCFGYLYEEKLPKEFQRDFFIKENK